LFVFFVFFSIFTVLLVPRFDSISDNNGGADRLVDLWSEFLGKGTDDDADDDRTRRDNDAAAEHHRPAAVTLGASR